MFSMRKSSYEDLDEMMKIFEIARKYMEDNGNPSQWSNNRPGKDLVINDIENGESYVVLNDDEIVGTFACIDGIEPTYLQIDGKWLNDDPYLTIHRIASNGKIKGIFDYVIGELSKLNKDIRIDTHKDNKTMLHLIRKNGFEQCGIIIVDDGTERIAFQKLCRSS